MKIKIGDFEVDVKAKSDFKQKMNPEDTKHFLYILGNAFADASKWNKVQGLEYTAQKLEEMFSDISSELL